MNYLNNGNFVFLTIGASKSSITPDDTVVISAVVKNEGQQELTGVTVSFSLDADIVYIPSSALYSYNDGAVLPLENLYATGVSFVLPVILSPGDVINLSFAVSVSDEIAAGASYIINSSVASNEFPSGLATDTVFFSTSFARISACKRGQDTDGFTLELTNTGNITAQNIVITDMLPCPFSLRDIYVGDALLEAGVDYAVDGGCVTVNLPFSIEPSGSILIRFLS